MDKDNKVGCKPGSVALAFMAGAGIATSAFLLATGMRKAIRPSAEKLIKKCNRAFEALDDQIQHQFAA